LKLGTGALEGRLERQNPKLLVLRDTLRWLVWAVKIPIKLPHQILALMMNNHAHVFGLSFVFSNWPDGSPFRNSTFYRGMRIAELKPYLERIMVVNDFVDANYNLSTIPRFIPLRDSRRLGLYEIAKSEGLVDVRDVELQSPDELEMTMLKQLEALPEVDVSVIQRLNGDVIVMDGVHRLMAAFARDKSLGNVQFFITL